MKASLDNYDDLTNPRRHIQDIRNILKLMTQKSDAMYKIFNAIFYGFARVWYHSLKPGFFLHDLCVKVTSSFNNNILVNKSSIKFFTITQREDESTRAYEKFAHTDFH
jgi:hypothetical protein